MLTKPKSSGFTIVELIIVIIVIAILALIVITTYNGVQQKARNAVRIAAAKDWQKVLINYITAYGKYPSGINIGVSGTSGVCLGTGYPDWNNDDVEDCATNPTNPKHPNATWNAELQKIAPTLPDFNKTPVVGDSGNFYLGIFVRTDTIDGVAFWPYLIYYLEGASQACGLTPVINSSSKNTVTAPQSGGTDGKVTLCYIKLPDPASL